MAITATVDLGNGVSKASCYIIVPNAYVKKFDDESCKLMYDVIIYKDATDRATNSPTKRIPCRTVDHHKIDYDPTTSDNPFKLAYTHLKTNGSLSSVADA